MAGRVLLTVRPQNTAGMETFIRWQVDRDFLEAARQSADADGRCALVVSTADLHRWSIDQGVQHPHMHFLGGKFDIDLTELFNHRPAVDAHFNGFGRLSPTTAGAAAYEFVLESGQASVFSRGGFNAHPGLLDPAEGGPPLDTWQRQLWPETGVVLERVAFGASVIQMDVIRPSGKHRVELEAERTDERLWKHCDCAFGFVTRAATIEGIQKRLADHFDHGSRPIRLVSSGSSANAGDVFYRVPRTLPPGTDAVRTLFQPSFQLVFHDGSTSAPWSPRSIDVRSTTITLSDQSLKVAMGASTTFNASVDVTWRRTTTDWEHVRSRIDGSFRCLGSDRVALQDHTLWQYASVTPVPDRVVIGATASMPAWVQYTVEEPNRATPLPIDTVDLPLAPALGAEKWGVQVTVPPVAEDDPPRWRVTVRESEETRLQGFGVRVRVSTPPILAFQGRLPFPTEPPNAVRLAATVDQPDPLKPTSMVFETAAADDTSCTLIATLSANQWTITPRRGAVRVWFSSTRLAVVDLRSPARRNLRQWLDPLTGRAVSERDASHGLTPWSPTGTLRIATSGKLTLVEFSGPLAAEQHSRDGAVALAPWVECRDELDGPSDRRRLHHANLVLEHEAIMLADPMDRKTSNLIRTDCVEAVRESFSLAVHQLPETEDAPVAVGHWLPGAALVHPDGTGFSEPRVWWEPRTRLAALSDRLPIVHRAGTTEVLAADRRGSPSAWLRQEVRWEGWIADGDGRRPRVVVSAPAATPGPQSAENSAVPLLFAMVATAGWDWSHAVFGDVIGGVRIHHTATGHLIHDRTLTGAVRAVALQSTTPVHGAIVDVTGRATEWFDDGTYRENEIPLPVMITDGAHLFILEDGSIVITRWNATLFTLHIWDHGTLITPVVPVLGGLTAAIRSVVAVEADGDLIVAIACGTLAALVWRGSHADGTWTFSALNFLPALGTGANAFALTRIDVSGTMTPYLAVIPASGQQVDMWSIGAAALTLQSTSVWQESDDPAPRTIMAVALAAALPGESDLILLCDQGGTVISHELPRVNVRIEQPRQRWRPQTPGPRMMTVGLAAGRRQVLISNPTAGASLFDIDTGFVTTTFANNTDALDALGTVQNVVPQLTATTSWRFISWPGSPSAGRTDDASRHQQAGNALIYTFAGKKPLIQTGENPRQTEFRFECEDLRLAYDALRQVWVLAELPATTAPDPDRLAVKFPHNRGSAGRWRLYSHLPGEIPSLAGSVRLGGYPLSVIALDYLTFASDGDGIRPDKLRSIALAAVLLNPMDFGGRTVEGSEPFSQSEAEVRGLAHGNLLRIILTADDHDNWAIHQVESEGGVIVWAFPPTEAPEAGSFAARLSRFVADLTWDSARGIILKPRSNDCRAEILGIPCPLSGPLEPLVGFGLDEGKRFGFRAEPLTVPTYSEPALQRRLAADAIAAPADREFGAVAVAENDRVTWKDLATGAARFSATLPGSVRQLIALAVPTGAIAYASGRRIILNNSPIPSSNEVDFTAFAMDGAKLSPWLASGDSDGTVRITDVRTGRNVLVFDLDPAPIRRLALCDCGSIAWLAAMIEGSAEIVLLSFTGKGLLRRESLKSPSKKVSQLRLHQIDDILHIALGDETAIDWYVRAANDSTWTLQRSLTIDPDLNPVTAIAFVKTGADTRLTVAGNAGLVRAFSVGDSFDVFNLGTPVLALGFHGDLFAVTAGAIHRWMPTTNTSSSVAVAGIANHLAVVCVRAGRAVVITDQSTGRLEGFDAETGSPVPVAAVPDDAVFAVGDVPKPFALVTTDADSVVHVIDLTGGLSGAPLPLTTPAEHLAVVQVEQHVLVFTTNAHQVQAWDLETRLAIDLPFDLTVPVQALAACGGTIAAAGAGRAVRWQPTLAAPYPTEPPLLLPDDAVTAMALTSKSALAIAAADRIDIWDELTHPPRTLGPFADPVTVLQADGSELIFNAGHQLKVWDLDNNRCSRVFEDDNDDPRRITLTGGWLVAGLGVLRLWWPTAIREFNNIRQCRCDLRVEVGGQTADFERLSALVVDNRSLDLRHHSTDGSILPLQPVAQDSGVYAFLGGRETPQATAGREVFALDTDLGLLAWSRVREAVQTWPVKVLVPRVDDPRLYREFTAEAYIIQLETATVRDTVATASSIISARVHLLDLPAPQALTLHLGEHVVRHGSSPPRLAAHLEATWRVDSGGDTYTVITQGPISLTVDWKLDIDEIPELVLLPSVFQSTPSLRDPATASALQDIGWPRADGSLEAIDLVSTSSLLDIEPVFLRGPLIGTDLPLLWQKLDAGDLPVDLCMDEHATIALGGQPVEVPGLAHRLAMGARLRYPQDQGVPFDLPRATNTPRWIPLPLQKDRTLWRLSPVLRDGRRCVLARQSLVIDTVRPTANEPIRTDTLFCLAAPSSNAPRPISGIWTASQLEPGPLSPVAAPPGLTMTGLIVRRILNDGQPALFTIVLRDLPDRSAIRVRHDAPPTWPDPTIRRDRLAAIQRGRFRILEPGPRRRVWFEAGSFFPEPSEAKGELAFRDRSRPETPSPKATPDTAVFLRERTAFPSMFPRGGCPADSLFAIDGGGVQTTHSPGWFLPAAFTLRGSPERPGAVRHIACQGVMRIGDDLHCAPMAEFAQREPMQLTPPPGAALTLKQCQRTALAEYAETLDSRHAARIELKWEETLGVLPLDPALTAATAVPIAAIEPYPATVDLSRVELAPTVFVQCVVRVDDELMEINAAESRFPVWDSSASARQVRDLSIDDRRLNITRIVGGSAKLLVTTDTPSKPLIAVRDDRSLDVYDGQNGNLLTQVTFGAGPSVPLAAAFAVRAAETNLLVTHDGTNPGLYDATLSSPPTFVRRTHSTAPSGVTALAACTVNVTLADRNDVVVSVEAALQPDGPDAVVLLWLSRKDQTKEELLRFPMFTARDQLAIVVAQTETADAIELAMTAAVAHKEHGKILTRTHTVQLPRDGSAAVTLPATEVSQFDIPRLTSWTLAVLNGRPRLLAGDSDGLLLDQNAITGGEPRTFRHASAIRNITTARSPLGPLVMVTDARVTTVWDADHSHALRRLPTEFPTALAALLPWGSQVGLVVADSATSEVRVFDLRTAVVTPPEFFLISPLPTLLDDIEVPCPLNNGHSESLLFTPVLVFDDRNDPTRKYVTPLRDLFKPQQLTSGIAGITVWKYDPQGVASQNQLHLNWDRAAHVRITWRCTNYPIEASLFEPLADKQLILKPFSASADRLGAVVLVDSTGPAATALFQRLAVFGDAAPTRPGVPDVQQRVGSPGLDFVIRISERETIDQPVPPVATDLSVVLVRHLSLGQTLTAAATAT